jgi:NAD(P)-dependent dehydrogenase (short-subunit alcohol dehydrogenase family)
MGSIGDNDSGGYYGYRVSNAALNAAGVSGAHDLKAQGIAVVVLHPGAVRTEMTGGHGAMDPDESAHGLLKPSTNSRCRRRAACCMRTARSFRSEPSSSSYGRPTTD